MAVLSPWKDAARLSRALPFDSLSETSSKKKPNEGVRERTSPSSFPLSSSLPPFVCACVYFVEFCPLLPSKRTRFFDRFLLWVLNLYLRFFFIIYDKSLFCLWQCLQIYRLGPHQFHVARVSREHKWIIKEKRATRLFTQVSFCLWNYVSLLFLCEQNVK